ncbi:hypothetical protein [Xenorhabdus taiwanensis]|uniref:Uncharacterized protein n=1 Tax=Xenorhabdus taiwanensis TaxID=3085177 RepID=A0ABN7C5J6_9GAMM|nr:hypothetical protein TCT1_25440 [Xenorhabdus sp. TCT-1]
MLLEYSSSIRSDDDESRDRLAIEVDNLDLMISPENIIKLCAEIENLHNKLAEYENMDLVDFTNDVELEYVKNGQHGFIQGFW